MAFSITKEQYAQKFEDILTYIETSLIRPATGVNSKIKKRIITSQGTDQEQWLGFLRDGSKVVDIWVMTLANIRGLAPRDKGDTTGFDKPFQIYIEYFADYTFGTDASNSEAEFRKKCLYFDYLLEDNWSCLPNSTIINDWQFNYSVMRFKTSSVHWAKGFLNLRLENNY